MNVPTDGWYFARDDSRAGPISLAELRVNAAAGRLAPDDLVWHEGLPDWIPAARVDGIAFGPAQPERAVQLEQPVNAGRVVRAEPPARVQPVSPAQRVVPIQRPIGGMLNYVGPAQPGDGPSPRTLELFAEAKPWIRFAGVAMTLVAIACLLLGILLLIGMRVGPNGPDPDVGAIGYFTIAMIHVGSILALFPAALLNRYASRVNDLLRMRRAVDLEAALETQRSFWRLAGRLAILTAGTYFVVVATILIVRAAR